MKKMNRKGFTIVELVIVIAVIAILAGVLIPTFSGITTRAQESARIQETRNAMMEYLAEQDDGTIKKNTKFYYFEKDIAAGEMDAYVFNYADGELTATSKDATTVTVGYTAANGDTPEAYTIKVGEVEAVSAVLATGNDNILIVVPAAE